MKLVYSYHESGPIALRGLFQPRNAGVLPGLLTCPELTCSHLSLPTWSWNTIVLSSTFLSTAMEVAGLALAVITVIKPTAEAIAELWTDGRNFGGDAERFRIRFSVQTTRLRSFERVLFEPNKFPLVQGRLFDQLPLDIQENFADLLRQLYELLEQYYVTRKRYGLESQKGKGGLGDMAPLSEEQRTALALAVGKLEDAKVAKSSSWVKKAWWVVGDKKSAEKLVVEFEGWTDRVRSLLDLAWWPLPFFSTVSQMEKLEKDEDAGQIGMLEGIGMRKLLAPGSSPVSDETAKSLRISRLDFREKLKFQNLEVGEIKGSANVVVEYKTYEQDKTGSINEIVSRRILQLVALLHEVKDDRFRVLRCINFFDDVPRKRIGFAFELPSPLAALDVVPTSLDIQLTSKKPKPSLGARIKLAHALAESLGQLHSVGWVHKSLRSENVLFFPHAEGNIDAVAGIKKLELARDPPEVGLDNPRIFGFEYSRLEGDFSSGRADYDVRRNIYRHPKRWGQPSEIFSKIHDIYGKLCLFCVRVFLLAIIDGEFHSIQLIKYSPSP